MCVNFRHEDFYLLNTSADALAKEGSKLRFDLMNLAAPDGWFTETLARYWGNRKIDKTQTNRK